MFTVIIRMQPNEESSLYNFLSQLIEYFNRIINVPFQNGLESFGTDYGSEVMFGLNESNYTRTNLFCSFRISFKFNFNSICFKGQEYVTKSINLSVGSKDRNDLSRVLIEDSELYIGINTINQNQSIQFRTKNFSGDRFYITRSNKITLEEKKLINRNLIEKVILQKKMIDHQVFEESQEAVESTGYQMINSGEGKGEFQLIELSNNVFLINPMKKLKLKDILEENDNYIYVYKGRIARMDEDFDKGSHRIMKVK